MNKHENDRIKSMLKFTIFNDVLEKKVVYVHIYILNPSQTSIKRYFKIICFQELLEGIYAYCVLYVFR